MLVVIKNLWEFREYDVFNMLMGMRNFDGDG